jgi:hypothetical protein
LHSTGKEISSPEKRIFEELSLELFLTTARARPKLDYIRGLAKRFFVQTPDWKESHVSCTPTNGPLVEPAVGNMLDTLLEIRNGHLHLRDQIYLIIESFTPVKFLLSEKFVLVFKPKCQDK